MLYIEQQAIYFYSPWVDKYEEVKENQYSADMQAILGLKKLNGSLTCVSIIILLIERCKFCSLNQDLYASISHR